jgi:hypothetical protein
MHGGADRLNPAKAAPPGVGLAGRVGKAFWVWAEAHVCPSTGRKDTRRTPSATGWDAGRILGTSGELPAAQPVADGESVVAGSGVRRLSQFGSVLAGPQGAAPTESNR